jgi:hypothetical protein
MKHEIFWNMLDGYQYPSNWSLFYSSVVNPWNFWVESGSGSADPYLWSMDPDLDADPDPAILLSDLQDVKNSSFFAYYFLKTHLHNFSKIKIH